MLIRALLTALLALALTPVAASAATISVQGSTILFAADPGETDKVAAFEDAESVWFTRFGGGDIQQDAGCTRSTDEQSIVCPKTAAIRRVLLDLGDGDDVAAISPSVTLPVVFDGGAGNDGLFGGSGVDEFNAGPGDDNVVARDSRGERVDCGAGNDTAISDDGDARVSCEQVEGDADLDGVRRPADCNDTNPAIVPGAADVPDNGVDENCDGVDATDVDRDRDGIARPQDCNDADAAIRPTARELIGNATDENCDTRIEPFPPVLGSLSNGWTPAGSGTRNQLLVARRFPRGTVVTVSCRGGGCPFRSFKRTLRRANENLHARFGDAVLARNARVDVRITRTNRVGRLLRFRMGTPGQPTVAFQCLPPGGRARDC